MFYLDFNDSEFAKHSQYYNTPKSPEINSKDRMEADASH